MFTGGRLPWGGPNAVEAKQAEFCAKPEITVGRLSNRVDAACEKAFADRPRFVRVLIDVERWVQGGSARAPRQEDAERDTGSSPHAHNYKATGQVLTLEYRYGRLAADKIRSTPIC
jgi:hypothetical protein